MAVLAILQPDARMEARLTEALAGAHVVSHQADWPNLERTLRDAVIDGCVVDGDHPDREWAFRRLSALRARYPTMALVAFVESDEIERVFDLGAIGVDGVLLGSAAPAGMRADVDRALSVARARRVELALTGQLPEPGPAAIAWAVEHAGPETSVERLSSGLGRTPSGLREALHEAGLPSPARLLLWGRLIQAGARIGDDGRKAEEVAFSLGYSTVTAFGRAMKLHTGLTPGEIPSGDGLLSVLRTLLERPDGSEPETGGSFGRRPMQTLATLASTFLLVACASFGGPSVDRGAIEDVVEGPPIDQLHMGILAVDAETGRTLYSHNARRKFVPASNQKILVTATALSLLGADWRYRTELRALGERHGSVLDGDLLLVASGDPSLSERYWASGTEALEAMADSLRATGITYVAGSGIVDVAAWDSATVGPTWEVEDLRYAYGSTGGAFAIDEGEIRAIVTAGSAVGEGADVHWDPLGTPDFVESRLETVPSDSTVRVRPSYLPESRRLVLDGTVPLGVTDTVYFAQRDPVRQAVAAWASAVERAGIVVEGGWSVRWTSVPEEECTLAAAPGLGAAPNGGDFPHDACDDSAADAADDVLVTFESPPVSDLIGGILKPSQNWMTEQMVRTLGARYGDAGSWREGTGVMQAYLVNEVGVDSLDVAPRDGSGLSAYNLVTPRAIVRILQEMRDGPFAEEFRAAMAEPGKEDSTLERRLLDLEGRVFAKTGTISNVNSLSGYLVRDDGREIVFSVLTNGSGLPASRVRAAIDDVVRGLAR